MASEPPIGSLFSAFLGYNPIKQLLGPTGALDKLPAHQVAYITGRSFFPKLIEQPFAGGLHLAFTFAAIATPIAVVASAAARQALPAHPPSRWPRSWPRARPSAAGLVGLSEEVVHRAGPGGMAHWLRTEYLGPDGEVGTARGRRLS